MEAEIKIDDIVEAEVSRIADFGAFVKINGRIPGLIHISQISHSFVKDVNEHLKVGDKVKARVIKIGPGNKIDLSLKIKKDTSPSGTRQKNKSFALRPPKNISGFKSSNLEEKLKEFLQQSQQNLANLKKHTEKHHR